MKEMVQPAEFQKKRVVFCGIVRDCERNLRRNLDKVEAFRSRFGSVQIVLVENDSRDGTKEVLRDLAKRDESAIVEMADYGTVTLPKRLKSHVNPSFSEHRISKMTRYRNRYLELIEDQIGYSNIDWVVMLDWDVLDFSVEGLFDSLRRSEEWDVATANGRSKVGFFGDVYYDAFAYRPLGLKGPCTEKSIFEGRVELKTKLDGADLIPVESGFNGMAVYRAGMLEGMRYRTEFNDDPRVEVWCEHVVFHRDLAAKGHDRIVINPVMKVSYISRFNSIKIMVRCWMSSLKNTVCKFRIKQK